MRYYVIFKPLEPIYNKLKAENVQLLETIHLVLLSTNRLQVIGIVHSEMKILSLITHPHVVPNLQDLSVFRTQIKMFLILISERIFIFE